MGRDTRAESTPATTTSTSNSAMALMAFARRSLMVITGFNVVSALLGSVILLVPGPLSVPTELLNGTIFSSYLVPGVILGVVVGGTQGIAFVLQLRRRAARHLWTVIAGFGMVIWIVTEMGMLSTFVGAQLLYLAIGLLQLACVFALLGVVSWLPRAADRTDRARIRTSA